MIEPLLDQIPTATASLTRGKVVDLRPDGLVEVQATGSGQKVLLCRILVQNESDSSWLVPGTEVLVSTLSSDQDDGIVLGRIDNCRPAPETRTIQAKQIVIEAGEELELRCGQGTIKIQQDGKIIIRGEDILNKAKGTNRIKGGSVGIN